MTMVSAMLLTGDLEKWHFGGVMVKRKCKRNNWRLREWAFFSKGALFKEKQGSNRREI